MIVHLLSILGLGLLCAGWILFQKWIARFDPEPPGVEGDCGGCAANCRKDDLA